MTNPSINLIPQYHLALIVIVTFFIHCYIFLCLQAKLVKMFSKQLVHKAGVANLIDAHILDCYPNTEQWLQVVGLPSKTVKVK